MNFFHTCMTTLLVTSAVGFLAGAAYGESYTLSASVTNVKPIYKTVVVNKPVTTCAIVEVPIYETVESKESGDVIGSLIIGGLIGSAIGNNVSDNAGSGTAGAVLGSIIGANEAQKGTTTTTQKIIGYRQTNQCNTTNISEAVQQLSHYEVVYEVLGLTGKKASTSELRVGDSIPVAVTVNAK